MGANDYCSYELSLALKAVGFNVPCNYGYSVKMRLEPEVSFGEPKMVHSKDQKNYNDNRKGIEKGLSFCSVTTLWHAQKWLREVKGIDNALLNTAEEIVRRNGIDAVYLNHYKKRRDGYMIGMCAVGIRRWSAVMMNN